MDTIQAEALRRAKEMQSKTSSRINDRPQFVKPDREEHHSGDKVQQSPAFPENTKEVKEAKESPSLFADKEKLLILALILLLSGEENSDPSLTLALLYLII